MNPDAEKRSFLIRHPWLVIDHVSLNYPLTSDILDRFGDVLDWYYLSQNEHLPWSLDFIDRYVDRWYWKFEDDGDDILIRNPALTITPEFISRFHHKIDWCGLSQYENLCITTDMLHRYSHLWSWDFLSKRNDLPWSEELVEQYADKWDWDMLSGNPKVPWTTHLIQKYRYLINVDKFINLFYPRQWYGRTVNPVVDELLSYKNPNKTVFTPQEMKLLLHNPDWVRMSLSERMPWSENLIDQYRCFWNWEDLSYNESIPWTAGLIKKFENYWEWGKVKVVDDGWEYTLGLSTNNAIPFTSELLYMYMHKWCWDELSMNKGIPWSPKIIELFSDKWEWNILSLNESVPWDLDLLKKFEDRWNYKSLSLNMVVINKVFGGMFDKEEDLCSILSEIQVSQIKNLQPSG